MYNAEFYDPSKQFFVVKHRELNDPNMNIEAIVEKVHSELGTEINGREIIPVIEGDVFSHNGQVVLTHAQFTPRDMESRVADGRAAYLNQQLSKIMDYDGPLRICLEAKFGTSDEDIIQATRAMQVADLIPTTYFDSYDGSRLERVRERKLGYNTSLHNAGHLGPITLQLPTSHEADIETTFCRLPGNGDNIQIWGAVPNRSIAEQAADTENVLGIYWRGEEGSNLKTFLNSFGSEKRF